jgi:rSAM-associated Gly-rich repeat protein
MNSGSETPKPSKERSLAQSLGVLLAVTSGLMLGSTANTQAAAANPTSAKTTDRDERLEVRVQRIQEQLSQGAEANYKDPSSGDIHPMWWGNWHNWHPGWGWRNGGWGNGGWHNWHNWRNWHNW